jgi:predicted membrane protein
MLKKIGMNFNIDFFQDIIAPVRNVFHILPGFVFSWPRVLIIVGLIMMAGKRSSGIVMIVIGGIFLIPKIFQINGFSGSFFLPLLLMALGIGLIAKHFFKENREQKL